MTSFTEAIANYATQGSRTPNDNGPTPLQASSMAPTSCCTITSLDEILGAGVKIHTGHEPLMVHTPTTPAQGAVTGLISAATIAGMMIGADIFNNSNQVEQEAKDLLKLLKDKESLTPEQQALKTFLSRRRNEAGFQKWVAGFISGLGSGAIFIGQFVMIFSPIGLGLLGIYGFGHLVNSIRNFVADLKVYKLYQAKDPDHSTYIKKKLNSHLRNMACWLLFSVGISALTTLSVAGLVATTISGVAPSILMGLGFTTLILGALGTVKFNNTITGPKFFPNLLKSITPKNPDGLNQLPSLAGATKRLEELSRSHKIVKIYRQYFMDKRLEWGRNQWAKLKIGSLRFINSFFTYGTMGLIQSPFMEAKFAIKGMSTKLYAGNDNNRWQTLACLKGQSIGENISQTEKLKLLKDSPYVGGVFKIFARYHCTTGFQVEWGKKTGIQKFLPQFKFPKYSRKDVDYLKDLDHQEYTEALANLMPCCDGNSDAESLLSSLLEQIDPQDLSEGAKLVHEIERAVDHFLVYQLKKEIRYETAFWSEYRGAFSEP